MIKEKRDKKAEIKEYLIEDFKIVDQVADRLIAHYGFDVGRVIKDKPYILCHYLIDWQAVNDIIDKINSCKDEDYCNKNVVAAAIVYVIETMTKSDGHTFIYKSQLEDKIEEMGVVIDKGLLNEVMTELGSQDELIIDEDIDGRECVYLTRLYEAEVELAELIEELVGRNIGDKVEENRVKEFMYNYGSDDFKLTKKQQEAVVTALSRNICIIKGGAGTGKTTVTKSIVDGFKYLGQTDIKLVSFTGKATERIHTATGMEATTIHRLLGIMEDGNRVKGDRIKADVIIVDEVGMIGLELLNMLLESVKENKNIRIVLIGDENQLASIAPGNVLKDLIRSGVIPMVHLQEVVRQDKDNLIITNANKVIKGIGLDGSRAGIRLKKGEFEFIEADEASIKGKVIKTIDKLLATGTSVYDIQVMSPVRKGTNGVIELNRAIADKYNPILERDIYKFAVLDPVVAIRNNYNKNIFNGQNGVVKRIDSNSQKVELITVDFNGKKVIFINDGIDNIEVSYANTIHKMQGSESKVAIIIIEEKYKTMLSRELIYVGITRGVERVIIIGNKETFNEAVQREQKHRNSLLTERIGSRVKGVNSKTA